MRYQLVFLIFLSQSALGQKNAIISFEYSNIRLKKNAEVTTQFKSLQLAGGVRFKESFDVSLAIDYFWDLNDKFYKQQQNVSANVQLRYIFLKNSPLRPGFQLDLGGVVYSNLKNAVVTGYMDLVKNQPSTYQSNYTVYSTFKNWGPVISPKTFLLLDFNFVNFYVGGGFEFTYYKEQRLTFPYSKLTNLLVGPSLCFGVVYKFQK